MDILKLANQIKKDSYSYKVDEVFSEIQGFIDLLISSKICLDTILPVLNIMLKAIEDKDVITVGDCIEYGLLPFLNEQDVELSMFSEKMIDLQNVSEQIFYFPTYSDELALCVKNEAGKTIRLNSLFSPENEVDNWISELEIKKTTTIICIFGMGTGLFAEKLLMKLPENGKLLIYEPKKEILDYCNETGKKPNSDEREKNITKRIKNITDDDRVSLIVEESDDLTYNSKLNKYFGLKSYIDLMGMVIVKHNGYDKLYPKGYLNYLRAINGFRTRMEINKNTVRLFKNCYLENYLHNIWDYKNVYSVKDIEKIIPAHVPVVIVSAGPSLDKNIDLLGSIKNHCLIFAVDSAVRFLLKRNIVPDITITFDPNKNVECFPDDRSRSVPAMMDMNANPKIVNKYKGKMFLFSCSNEYAGKLLYSIGKNTYHLLDHGGSVATAAFKMMRNIGQKKIILVGQDLAFENGKSHAGGINDGVTYMRSEVDGINGEKVITRADWLGYLKWFEQQIEDIKLKCEDIEVIDATEGGALIHGSKVMTLKDAINSCKDKNGKLPDYNFENELEKINIYLNEEEHVLLIRKHKEALGKLKEIQTKSENAIRICRQLLIGIKKGTVSESYLDKEKKKIFRINEFVRRCTVFHIINEYLITDVIDDISYLMLKESDPKSMEINKINMLKISFEAILDAAIKVQEKAKEIEETKIAKKN